MRARAVIDRYGDVTIALVLAAWIQVDLWETRLRRRVVGGRGVLAVLALLVMLPLAARRRVPAATLLTATGALVLVALLVTDSRGIPVEVFLAMLLAFYSVGAHCDDRRSLAVAATAIAAIAVADVARPGTFSAGGSRPGAWLAFAIAWLVGRDLRRRRQRVTDLEEHAARLEREREEQAQLAVAEERARIARELHDVVAHGVSVIVVQAQAGPALVDDPERAAACSTRSSRADATRSPSCDACSASCARDQQLAIGHSPASVHSSLVDQLRAAGLAVDLQVQGEPAHAAGRDRSFRLPDRAGGAHQPLKHAGATHARVLVRYGARQLDLEVVTTAAARRNGTGGGHGLIGMHERVALLGGALEPARARRRLRASRRACRSRGAP